MARRPAPRRPPPRQSASRSERRLAAVQHRRQQAAARSAAARRATQRRRRLKTLAVLATVAVAASIIAVVTLRGDEEPSRELRAEVVPGAAGPLAISVPPASYRAVYRAETYSGSTATVTTEDISIQRPFDGRVFIREGEPPGGAVQFEGRSTFGLYGNFTAGAVQVAAGAPAVALGDLRLASSLDALVGQGLFELRERRRAVLPAEDGAPPEARECQVYRTGSPLQTLTISAPTATDYVDACLDGTGLLLEEVAVAGGRLAQRLTATSIERDVAFDPGTFAVEGPRVGPDQGGAEVTEIDPSVSPGAGYWALDTPPAGFTHRGRFLVEAEGPSHVDVYVRGIDLVTIRQGPPAAEPEVRDTPPGGDVELGPLGPARTTLAATGATVIAHPGSEGFVHVTGTLAPAEIEAIAAALRRS